MIEFYQVPQGRESGDLSSTRYLKGEGQEISVLPSTSRERVKRFQFYQVPQGRGSRDFSSTKYLKGEGQEIWVLPGTSSERVKRFWVLPGTSRERVKRFEFYQVPQGRVSRDLSSTRYLKGKVQEILGSVFVIIHYKVHEGGNVQNVSAEILIILSI